MKCAIPAFDQYPTIKGEAVIKWLPATYKTRLLMNLETPNIKGHVPLLILIHLVTFQQSGKCVPVCTRYMTRLVCHTQKNTVWYQPRLLHRELQRQSHPTLKERINLCLAALMAGGAMRRRSKCRKILPMVFHILSFRHVMEAGYPNSSLYCLHVSTATSPTSVEK